MISQNKEKILIFCSRETCYLSANFFAHQIGGAFEEMGFWVEICELEKEDHFDDKLKVYMEKEYRLILDFNSLLPRMVLEDDSFYLDHLRGPFFDYILDHPLFHYNCLATKAKNMHVIVLDEAHKTYAERYYSNLRRVFMLPLGASEAFCQGQKQPPDGILFLGTYEKPENAYRMIKEAKEPLKKAMEALAERRISEPLLPMGDAYRQYLTEQGIQLADREFALFMNAMYPVDMFIRDYFRKAVLDRLTAAKIPIKAAGEGWEKYSGRNHAFFKQEESVLFPHSFRRIAKEQILLNVSPMFNRGLHDRILAGMANKTAVLTDGNPYLAEQFKDREVISTYSLTSPHTLCEAAGELMENHAFREKLQTKGWEVFSQKHTWGHRARQILAWADEMEGLPPTAAY